MGGIVRLKNKRTGEIMEFDAILPVKDVSGDSVAHLEYKSLTEFNEEWEDYEEPKDTNYWCIDSLGKIEFHSTVLDEVDGTPNNAMVRKIIGNYFDTREQAEKAVEKLKTAKRLKDKGFRFDCWYGGSKDIVFSIPQEIIDRPTAKDLDLLFGGEE